MTKQQIATLFAALALFFGLYFGFDTKPKARQAIETSRSLQGETTGFETLLGNAKNQLSAEQSAKIGALEQQLTSSTAVTDQIKVLKTLSSQWYAIGQLPVAGGYAEQVAALENADSSWSVAGAIFFEGILRADGDPKLKDFCAGRAKKAFENAASLNPEQIQHRVNLALVMAENPEKGKEMAPALMLRELAEKHPNDPAPFNALGRLSIKTGQWENAIKRLEHSWSLDKKNPNTPCLLAKAYEGAGNAEKASEFAKLCK